MSRLIAQNVWEKPDLLGMFARLDTCPTPRNVLTITDRAESEDSLDISFTEETPYFGSAEEFARGIFLGYKMDNAVNEAPFVLGAIPSPYAIHTLALAHDCRVDCDRWECGAILRDVGLRSFTGGLRRFCNVTTLYLSGQENGPSVPALLGPEASDDVHLPYLTRTHHHRPLRRLENLVVRRAALLARQVAGSPLRRLIVRGQGACHAYWPGTRTERAAAFAHATNGLGVDKAIPAWLRHCEVTLEGDQLTTEILDGRTLGDCDCPERIVGAHPPWNFVPRQIEPFVSVDLLEQAVRIPT